MDKKGFTYILASQKRGTLYIGVTSNLAKRMWEHREGIGDGFSSKYKVFRLVHFEEFDMVAAAIAREKQLKQWHRDWKINLVEENNSEWKDLYQRLNM